MWVYMPGVLVYWCQGSMTWGTVHSLREALIVRRWGVLFPSPNNAWWD
jgi:hypothetical protein